MNTQTQTQTLDQMVQKFEEEGFLEANMGIEELKSFLDAFGYEYDPLDDPIGSLVQIGSEGGVKYFTPEGKEVVIAWNEGAYPEFPKEVIQWLLDHEVSFYF